MIKDDVEDAEEIKFSQIADKNSNDQAMMEKDFTVPQLLTSILN